MWGIWHVKPLAHAIMQDPDGIIEMAHTQFLRCNQKRSIRFTSGQ